MKENKVQDDAIVYIEMNGNSDKKQPHSAETDTETDQDEIDVQRTCLRQILFLMSLIGCYRYKDCREGKKLWIVYSIYTAFIFCILLFFFVKTAVGFAFLESKELHGQGIVLVWSMQCIIEFIILQKASSCRFGYQKKALKLYNTDIIPSMQDFGVSFEKHTFFKMLTCVIAVTVVVGIAFMTALDTTGLYSTGIKALTTHPLPQDDVFKVLEVMGMTFTSMVDTFPTFYMINISMLLKDKFQLFNKELHKQTCSNACKVPDQIQKLRTMHLKLCQSTEMFDKDLKYMYGTQFVFNLGLSLYILYVILRVDLEGHEAQVQGYICWFILNMLLLCMNSMFAAMVNEKAHASLETIYYLNLEGITVEKLAQLNLFLSKLTGTQVGFTASGLLVITKEFILTITGAFLTYFAVLYTL